MDASWILQFVRIDALGAIFISYRRNDSQGEAGRLFDDLVEHFGQDMVFMDVAGIEAGRDFRKAIDEKVAECGVLLVVIGPAWLTVQDEHEARRLDDPGDFVRIEVASALKRDIAVIPVLVHEAKMPRAAELPESLRELAYRNCIEVTHARWRSDVQLLIEALRRLLGSNGKVAAKMDLSPASSPPDSNITRLDPAIVQRVSKELAVYIGPIAEIVVKRAAAQCSSSDDLYFKAAEEIDSPSDRERFLGIRSFRSPTAASQPATSGSRSEAASSSPLSQPLSQPELQPEKVRFNAHPRSRQKARYPVLVVAAIVVLFLAIVFAKRFAPSPNSSAASPPKASTQENTNRNPAPTGANASLQTPPSQSNGIEPPSFPVNNPSPVSHAEPTSPQRIPVDPEVVQGLLVKKVVPVYPPLAQQARIKGTVVLDANISKDGAVESLKLVRGHPLLVPAAIDAVKQWRYRPYMRNGAPTAVSTQITVNFTLTSG